MKKIQFRDFHYSIVVYFISLGIICILVSSCSIPRAIKLRDKNIEKWEEHQWKEIKSSRESEADAWTIYYRKSEKLNFWEFKIEGVIEATPKLCISLFRQDIYEQASDLANKKYPIYEIVDESKNSILTYVIHDEPFPLKNTEMSVRYLFYDDVDGSKGVRWAEAWDESEIVRTRKLSRVQTFRGAWNFYPISNNSNKAVNKVEFDPKKMPMWLVRPMVYKFLKNGLRKLRNESLM